MTRKKNFLALKLFFFFPAQHFLVLREDRDMVQGVVGAELHAAEDREPQAKLQRLATDLQRLQQHVRQAVHVQRCWRRAEADEKPEEIKVRRF